MKHSLFPAAVVLCFAVLFSGCNRGYTKNERTDSVPLADNSRTCINYEGTYKGVLPCADCEGIETVLILGKYTYTLKTSYKGKGTRVNEEKGSYSWNEDGQIITLEGVKNAPDKYFVGENRIWQLDMDGKWITDKFADIYVLTKE
ncbi:copper resistance protein NlpE [Dysgonomonas reticulitermitis]